MQSLTLSCCSTRHPGRGLSRRFLMVSSEDAPTQRREGRSGWLALALLCLAAARGECSLRRQAATHSRPYDSGPQTTLCADVHFRRRTDSDSNEARRGAQPAERERATTRGLVCGMKDRRPREAGGARVWRRRALPDATHFFHSVGVRGSLAAEGRRHEVPNAVAARHARQRKVPSLSQRERGGLTQHNTHALAFSLSHTHTHDPTTQTHTPPNTHTHTTPPHKDTTGANSPRERVSPGLQTRAR